MTSYQPLSLGQLTPWSTQGDWLDQFRAVSQMGQCPGHAEIIEGMVAYKGQLLSNPKGRIYNLYRAKEGGLR